MIVLAIKQSNKRQFEASYEMYHQKVYAYLYQKTNSAYMAEELVQLAFIKLWNFRHTLNDSIPLEPQLFVIARSCLLDFLRKEANQQKMLEAMKQDAIELGTLHNDSDAENQVQRLLNILPTVRKRVFSLSRLEGFSNKEIADKLEISIRTVEKHISLAIKQLKIFR